MKKLEKKVDVVEDTKDYVDSKLVGKETLFVIKIDSVEEGMI